MHDCVSSFVHQLYECGPFFFFFYFGVVLRSAHTLCGKANREPTKKTQTTLIKKRRNIRRTHEIYHFTHLDCTKSLKRRDSLTKNKKVFLLFCVHLSFFEAFFFFLFGYRTYRKFIRILTVPVVQKEDFSSINFFKTKETKILRFCCRLQKI